MEIFILELFCIYNTLEGPFLLSWMPEVVDMGHSTEFLNLLINFVHYNAAFLDGEVVIGLVRYAYKSPYPVKNPILSSWSYRMTCALARQSPDSNVLTVSDRPLPFSMVGSPLI